VRIVARTDPIQTKEAPAGQSGRVSPSTLAAALVFLAALSTAVSSLAPRCW
jgi:hypothetical protein